MGNRPLRVMVTDQSGATVVVCRTKRSPQRADPSVEADVPHRPLVDRGAGGPGQGSPDGRPRAAHEGWEASPTRPDPVALLESQAESRVQELVPIRYGRMLVSPFTFYRGAALIMASDLATTPTSGLHVQACGDAHLSNFGVFASAERNLVFDVNDFDETLPGPWEWDVKRLAASLAIAGRDRGFSDQERAEVVLDAVSGYRTEMAKLADHEGSRRVVRPHGHREGAQRTGRRARTDRKEARRTTRCPRPRPRRTRPWPRHAPATACRRWTSSPRWSTGRPDS